MGTNNKNKIIEMDCMTLKHLSLTKSELEIIAEAFAASAPWDKLVKAIEILKLRCGESGILQVKHLEKAAETYGIDLPTERRHLLAW